MSKTEQNIADILDITARIAAKRTQSLSKTNATLVRVVTLIQKVKTP